MGGIGERTGAGMSERGGGKIAKAACPHCGKLLQGKAGVRAHIIAKHSGDDDESFADRAIQAEIDRACGIPTDDDWLLP